MTENGMDSGGLVTRDMMTGIVIEHDRPPAPCVGWVGDKRTNVRWAGTGDEMKMWFGPFDGPWELEKDFDLPTWIVDEPFGTSERFIAVFWPDDEAVVDILDATTGESVGPSITAGGRDLLNGVFSRDGSLVALGFGVINRPDGDGVTVVLDAESSEELFRFDTPLPAAYLVFDMDTDELVVATVGNNIAPSTYLQGKSRLLSVWRPPHRSAISAFGMTEQSLSYHRTRWSSPIVEQDR